MFAQVEKSKENKSRAAANSAIQNKSTVKRDSGFVDNRSETVAQRKLQKMINDDSKPSQLRSIIKVVDKQSNAVQMVKLRDAKQTYPFLQNQIDQFLEFMKSNGESVEKFLGMDLVDFLKEGTIFNIPDYHFGVNDQSKSTDERFARLAHRWPEILKHGGRVAEFPYIPEVYKTTKDKPKEYLPELFDDKNLTPFAKDWNKKQGKTMNGARYSKASLVHTIKKGGVVRFHLDNMNDLPDILSKPKKGEKGYTDWQKDADIKHKLSVTSKELRYVQRFWKKNIPETTGLQFDESNVKFYLKGKEVGKPF